MSELSRRFPKGHAMLRSALDRERIPLRMVSIDMTYTGVSWGLRVDCDAAGYHRQDVLGPYALSADTAFGELCQRIAEELAESLRGLPSVPWPGTPGPDASIRDGLPLRAS